MAGLKAIIFNHLFLMMFMGSANAHGVGRAGTKICRYGLDATERHNNGCGASYKCESSGDLQLERGIQGGSYTNKNNKKVDCERVGGNDDYHVLTVMPLANATAKETDLKYNINDHCVYTMFQLLIGPTPYPTIPGGPLVRDELSVHSNLNTCPQNSNSCIKWSVVYFGPGISMNITHGKRKGDPASNKMSLHYKILSGTVEQKYLTNFPVEGYANDLTTYFPNNSTQIVEINSTTDSTLSVDCCGKRYKSGRACLFCSIGKYNTSLELCHHRLEFQIGVGKYQTLIANGLYGDYDRNATNDLKGADNTMHTRENSTTILKWARTYKSHDSLQPSDACRAGIIGPATKRAKLVPVKFPGNLAPLKAVCSKFDTYLKNCTNKVMDNTRSLVLKSLKDFRIESCLLDLCGVKHNPRDVEGIKIHEETWLENALFMTESDNENAGVMREDQK